MLYGKKYPKLKAKYVSQQTLLLQVFDLKQTEKKH